MKKKLVTKSFPVGKLLRTIKILLKIKIIRYILKNKRKHEKVILWRNSILLD